MKGCHTRNFGIQNYNDISWIQVGLTNSTTTPPANPGVFFALKKSNLLYTGCLRNKKAWHPEEVGVDTRQ